MKKSISLFLCVALLSCSPAAEMTQESQKEGPIDQARITTTTISGFASFSEIGIIHGDFNTSAEVKVRNLGDSRTGEKSSTVVIEVVGPRGLYTQSDISGSALDETISVLKEFSSLEPHGAEQRGFHRSRQILSTTYMGRHHLGLSVSSSQEKLYFSVQAQQTGQTAYLNFSDIEEFMNLIKQAKQEIDSLR